MDAQFCDAAVRTNVTVQRKLNGSGKTKSSELVVRCGHIRHEPLVNNVSMKSVLLRCAATGVLFLRCRALPENGSYWWYVPQIASHDHSDFTSKKAVHPRDRLPPSDDSWLCEVTLRMPYLLCQTTHPKTMEAPATCCGERERERAETASEVRRGSNAHT